jgi:hypothetical protein
MSMAPKSMSPDLIRGSGNRFPAFAKPAFVSFVAKPAAAGEGRLGKVMLRKKKA